MDAPRIARGVARAKEKRGQEVSGRSVRPRTQDSRNVAPGAGRRAYDISVTTTLSTGAGVTGTRAPYPPRESQGQGYEHDSSKKVGRPADFTCNPQAIWGDAANPDGTNQSLLISSPSYLYANTVQIRVPPCHGRAPPPLPAISSRDAEQAAVFAAQVG